MWFLLLLQENVENLKSQFNVPLREKAAFFNCLGPYLTKNVQYRAIKKKKKAYTAHVTLVFPTSIYADPLACVTSPVFKTKRKCQ